MLKMGRILHRWKLSSTMGSASMKQMKVALGVTFASIRVSLESYTRSFVRYTQK